MATLAVDFVVKNGIQVLGAKLGVSGTQQHTIPAVASDVLTLNAATQTLVNKTLTAPIALTVGPNSSQQHSFPAVASDVLTLNAAVQNITNKSITLSTGNFSSLQVNSSPVASQADSLAFAIALG